MGNLQHLGLARALLHEPELLILDEPANGLDPAGVLEIRILLESLANEKGVTIFMSSHILTEVDRLATRMGIIHQGRLIEELDTINSRSCAPDGLKYEREILKLHSSACEARDIS